MLIQRLIYGALLIGLLGGFVLSLGQFTAVNPILFAAETFEVEEDVEADSHHHGEHQDSNHSHHSHEGWAPEDGLERSFFSLLSNVFAGVGFAAVLLAVMNQLQSMGVARFTWLKGALWGLGGFLTFMVAPGIGLPPEIPGIQAPPLESRQLWWVLTVLSVGAGLLVLVFAPVKLKLLGLVGLVLPYLVSIPHHDGPAFVHPDPGAVETLTQLHQQFILASGISNLVFWLVIGVGCGWLLARWQQQSA